MVINFMSFCFQLNGIKQISDQFMKRRSELKSLTATSWVIQLALIRLNMILI